jgi:hypothetical protein
VNFYYDNFENSDLTLLDDAEIFSEGIELNLQNVSYASGVCRILHPEKVQFQDVKSMTFASFNTSFTFSVNSASNTLNGNGLAFIIVAITIIPHFIILVVERLAF